MTAHLGFRRTAEGVLLSGGVYENSFSQQSKTLLIEAALQMRAFAAAQPTVLEVNLCPHYIVVNVNPFSRPFGIAIRRSPRDPLGQP